MRFLIIFLSACISGYAGPLFVGISGASGSGKTTLVKAMQEHFDAEVVVLSMDNYYRDLSSLPFEDRKKINFDDPAALDLSLLKEQILQLKKGVSINQPIYDFHTKTRSSAIIQCEPAKVIVIEGFLLLALPEIAHFCDLKIFIEVDEIECLFRIIERDRIHRETSVQETKERYIRFVRPAYQKYILESRYQANLIIPHGLENKLAFQILLHTIHSMLSGTFHS